MPQSRQNPRFAATTTPGYCRLTITPANCQTQQPCSPARPSSPLQNTKHNSSVQPCSIGPVINPALSKLQTRASHAPHRARYDCTSSWDPSHTPDKQALQCLECLQGLNQYICRHSSLQLLQQQLPGNSKLPPPEALLQATASRDCSAAAA